MNALDLPTVVSDLSTVIPDLPTVVSDLPIVIPDLPTIVKILIQAPLTPSGIFYSVNR